MYSTNRWRVEQLVRIALLSALCIVGRFIFASIPNVQPMTVIYLLVASYVSLKESIMIIIVSMLITNFYLGMGPWTVFQIVIFSLVIGLSAIGKQLLNTLGVSKRCIIGYELIMCGLSGILYGLFYSVAWVYFAQINHFWVYYMRGLPYDLAHAVGNICFYIVLAPILRPIFKRYIKKTYTIE